MAIPERLPIEDLENGRYIHDKDRVVVLQVHPGTEGEAQHVYVEAEFFMDVQKERDDYRRAAALLNAALRKEGEPVWRDVFRILDSVGLGPGDANAMNGLIDQVRGGNF